MPYNIHSGTIEIIPERAYKSPDLGGITGILPDSGTQGYQAINCTWPLYQDFVLAYARLQHERGLDKPVLSPEEHEELHELALSILREQLPEGDAR